MSGRKTWFLLLVLVVVTVLVLLFGTGLFLMMRGPTGIQDHSVVEVRVGGSLAEFPPTDPIQQLFQSGQEDLWSLLQVFEAAAGDDRVDAIYMEIQPLSAGWAQIEELRESMKAFRETGKRIEAFLAVDIIREGELYLASAADRITVNPDSGFLVDGLIAEISFFKRTLDMLRVRPQFFQMKELKSPRNYDLTEMTPEFREMLRSLLADIQDRFIASVAEDRNLTIDTVREFLEIGMGTAQEGVERGLVDRVGYYSDVRGDLELKNNGEPEYRGTSHKRYLSRVEPPFQSGTKVAVVAGTGTIIAGKSEAFAEMIGAATLTATLRDIRKDDSIRGVILRVNSPGGSAVGSDMIWREIQLLRDAGKPVVVSMSTVAGSGGYYISMPANRIVTQPSTITGSIGVLFGKFDLSGLYNMLGVDIDRVQLAPNSDFFSLTSSFNDEQVSRINEYMESVYQSFVEKAAEGRAQSYAEMEEKARGRIYTGAQALELGLVDAVGGLPIAIEQMREELGLRADAGLHLEIRPRPRTMWELLTSGDLLQVRQKSSLLDFLTEDFKRLEYPMAWLLTPSIHVN